MDNVQVIRMFLCLQLQIIQKLFVLEKFQEVLGVCFIMNTIHALAKELLSISPKEGKTHKG